ncbi:MAG: carboxypeptidase regulatory-like domain-containing protein [Planctomycetes bacterium]|nr:carboxypeptidase regulatory-like domain-containing protein [Planctomycetota bacterium]
MTSIIRFFLVLSVAFLALPQSDAQAASAHRTGSLAGIVLDASGNAVADAHVQVEIHTPNGHVFNARMRTDRNGHFHLRQVPVGRGVVKAAKRGVGQGRTRISVKAGKTTRTRVSLS